MWILYLETWSLYWNEILFIFQLDQLTSAFGSSKKKRAMESRKKNKLSGADLENAVGAAAQQALKNTDITALQTGQWSHSVLHWHWEA